MPEDRLQKVIAHAGVCSRRKAEDLIEAGRVTVNGAVVRSLGTKVDPDRDEVRVDGDPIAREPREYWAVNKPKGVVTTVDDPHGRPTARELIDSTARIYPVGRLDQDSTGLLLFTNDGALTQRLTHPRYGHRKTYHVLVSGYPGQDVLDRLEEGVTLEDGSARALSTRFLHTTGDGQWILVVLGEGRKRQLRRMMDAVDYPVVHLRRVRVGPVHLGDLVEGEARRLTRKEREALGVSGQSRGRPGSQKGTRKGRR